MVFLIAYAIFEVPSNYFLKKLSPSKWIAFLMFSWGAVTMGLGGTKSYASVTGVRFLLGVFEAGLFPGLVYYLTFWYRTEERSIRVAFILASATLAGAFGGAIAYGVGHMNGTSGLSAWRWLFILEGIPSCLSSILVFLFLPDYPETANWLTPEEKELATKRLATEGSHGHGEDLTWKQAKETLTDWRLYAHYAVGFFLHLPEIRANWIKTDLFRHLGSFLQSLALYTEYYRRVGIQRSQCPTFHRPTLCCGIRCNHSGFLVRRPLQCVKYLPSIYLLSP